MARATSNLPVEPTPEEAIPAEATPDLRGRVIDRRYRVIEAIGEGGMGRVYRAEQLRLQRSVAIKVLHRDYSSVADFGKRFEREALAAARLDHPNCVAIQDYGRLEDGSLFLVMSYLHGVLLRDAMMKGGAFPIPRALHIARHVLCGLAHAHAAGIVHRDIKPENVMLVRHEGDEDFAKIFDFGIAKMVEGGPASKANLTVAGQSIGTPSYMSPEQALGRPLDARSDLYSLTVVLYEMLAGRAPFLAPGDPAAVMTMHAHRAPPTLAEGAPGTRFPEEIEALVRVGLAKDPGKRAAHAGEMLAAIDACTRAVAVPEAATHMAPAAAPRPPSRLQKLLLRALHSRRVMIGTAAVLGLALLGTVAWRALRADPAAEAQALLAGGRPAEAVSYLEARFRDIADDAPAQMQLGHAYAASRRYDDALRAYERACLLEPSHADDHTMRSNLMLMLDDERGSAPGAARFLIQVLDDDGARARVAELASRHRSPSHRATMRELAESLGLGARVDRLASYRLDLQQAATCQDRKAAVAKLRALGDPAAAPALDKARARKANGCLRDDAADAIRYLQSIDAAEPAGD